MSKKYSLNINFYNDWLNILRQQLIELGFKPSDKNDDISLQFFTLQRKLIKQKPRQVLFSNGFSCPADLDDGLQLIIKNIETGLDLKQHLSTSIANLNYQDKLLNDWGIHHLHMGTKLNTKGFINRTGPVLFVRFDDDYAYFISILEHGRYIKKQPWAMQKMVKIIHQNWPESIEFFMLKGVSTVSQIPSDKDIEDARSGCYNTLLQVDEDVAYAPIGMGLTTSGHSVDVVRTSHYYSNLVIRYEIYVKENFMHFIEEAEKQGVIFDGNIHFQLVIESNEVYALEVTTNTIFKLGPFS